MFSISHTPIHYALFSIIMLLNPLLHGAEKPAPQPKAETKLLFEHTETIKYMELSPDSRVLVVDGQDKPPVAYLTEKPKEMVMYGYNGYIREKATSNILDGIRLLISNFCDLSLDIGISTPIQKLSWSPDGSLFAYINYKDRISIRSLNEDFSNESKQFFNLHTMSWSPKSLFFAAAGKDGVYIWDTKNLSDKPRSIKYDQADSISFCDEDTIAIAGGNAYVAIYKYKKNPSKPFCELKGSPEDKFTHLNYDCKKGLFAASSNPFASTNSKVFLWDMSTQKVKHTYQGLTSVITCVQTSFSHKYLLFSSLNFHTEFGEFYIWDIDSGTKVKAHTGKNKIISFPCFSYDDKFAAYGFTDKLPVYERTASTISIFSTDENLSKWNVSWEKSAPGGLLQWDPSAPHLYTTNDKEVHLTKIT